MHPHCAAWGSPKSRSLGSAYPSDEDPSPGPQARFARDDRFRSCGSHDGIGACRSLCKKGSGPHPGKAWMGAPWRGWIIYCGVAEMLVGAAGGAGAVADGMGWPFEKLRM